MNAFFATTCFLIAIAPQGEASIFSVKPRPAFIQRHTLLLRRISDFQKFAFISPPINDNKGFCEFKLIYKIADRSNSALPKTAWARCVSIDQLIPSQPKHDGSMS